MNKIFVFLFVMLCTLYAQAQGIDVVQTGDAGYIWAKSGVNLRAAPSGDAAILAKLPMGTPVTAQVQDTHRQEASVTLFPAAQKSPAVVVRGWWLRVQSGEQVGYVFNRFALNVTPPSAQVGEERVGYDISLELQRAMSLSRPKISKKKVREDGAVFLKETRVYHNAHKTRLTVVQSYNDYGWGNATLTHPHMSVEQALIMFTALLPVDESIGVDYQGQSSVSVFMDQIPNQLDIKRNPKGGITAKWNWGAD